MTHDEIYNMARLHVRNETSHLDATCEEGDIIVHIEERQIAAIITGFVEQKFSQLCNNHNSSSQV